MTDIYHSAAYVRRPSVSAAGLFGRIRQTLRTWRERADGRADLVTLDERLLKDVALSDIEVRREAAKPFWRP